MFFYWGWYVPLSANIERRAKSFYHPWIESEMLPGKNIYYSRGKWFPQRVWDGSVPTEIKHDGYLYLHFTALRGVSLVCGIWYVRYVYQHIYTSLICESTSLVHWTIELGYCWLCIALYGTVICSKDSCNSRRNMPLTDKLVSLFGF